MTAPDPRVEGISAIAAAIEAWGDHHGVYTEAMPVEQLAEALYDHRLTPPAPPGGAPRLPAHGDRLPSVGFLLWVEVEPQHNTYDLTVYDVPDAPPGFQVSDTREPDGEEGSFDRFNIEDVAAIIQERMRYRDLDRMWQIINVTPAVFAE